MKQHYKSGQHFFPNGLNIEDKNILLEGDGQGETTLIISPNEAITLYQRNATGNSIIIRDLSIVIEGIADTFNSALQIVGPGTENYGQSMVRIQNVQFGYRDIRPIKHPLNPGNLQALPKNWVSLNGVYGYIFDQCYFTGQQQGGRLDRSGSYPLYSAISIESDDNITDIDGSLHAPHSMRGLITSCYFSSGIANCIDIANNAWIEGLHIENCSATNVWRFFNFASNDKTQRKGTFLSMIGNHAAFNCEAARIETGAGIKIDGNYFIPLPNGNYTSAEEKVGMIILGRKDANYGPNMCNINNNIFGLTHMENRPEYGIVIQGKSKHIYIDKNHFQICKPYWAAKGINDIGYYYN